MKFIGLAALSLAAVVMAAPAPVTQAADAHFLSFSSHDLDSPDGRTYRIIVAPPAGPPSSAGYPVIYVMDGNAWTPMISEIIRTNLEFGTQAKVESAIVVGIGYPIHGTFDMVRRDLDLTTETTVPADTGGSKVGGYEATIYFIEQRVKPEIEKRFPIDRKRQTLAGHSLGGLFALRTLMNHPDWYQTYLALSPSIWWSDATMLKEASALSADARQRSAHVYIGVGQLEQYWTPAYRAVVAAQLRARLAADPSALGGKSLEDSLAEFENNTARMVDNARTLAKILSDKGLDVQFDLFPEEDHFSGVASQLGRAVPFALRH